MLDHERLEVRDELGVGAPLQLRLEQLFSRRRLQFLEPLDLALGERLVGEVGQGRPPPERKCLAQAFPPAYRALEAVRVDELPVELEHVTRRASDQQVGAEELA